MKALVIDDSRAMRAILRKILRGIGVDVTEAEHGRAALEVLAGAASFDLALVDWNMPEMDGLQVVKAIRANHRLDEMRVMMVTTETEMGQVLRAIEAGASEYLMKPFNEAAVVEKLAILGLLETG
ncbi:MAG: response regulator [Labilithrix sp.]|nr:response regulator [Labilithrix sp.]MBX3218657.1 response regulator [Labilithrix sp.]